MPYTLVRHTGYSVGNNPQFKKGVEERHVETQVKKAIEDRGGLVLDSYTEARSSADQYNYPPGAGGLIPHAIGDFVKIKGLDEGVFIPYTPRR